MRSMPRRMGSRRTRSRSRDRSSTTRTWTTCRPVSTTTSSSSSTGSAGQRTWRVCTFAEAGLGRDEAIRLVRRHDGTFPSVYLGTPIEEVLDDIDMSVEEFVRVCDRFTNKKLFVCDARGELVKDRRGNLTKVNYDNPESGDTPGTSEAS